MSVFANLITIWFALHSAAVAQSVAGDSSRIDCGAIENDRLREISGIAASWRNPGILWVHNDSGDRNRIYAIDGRGRHRGTFTLVGARARDWEDIAVGPGPAPGASYIYVADIGDNDNKFPAVHVYRVREPALPDTLAPGKFRLLQVDRLTFTYPDRPRDAETLMIDPLSGDLYIVTKREKQVRVYRAAAPITPGEQQELVLAAKLPFRYAVAGDISRDGRKILIKSYSEIYYWQRRRPEPLAQALRRPPQRVPYVPEPQGEAVCWDPDGAGYYTTSEERNGIPAHLFYYPWNK